MSDSLSRLVEAVRSAGVDIAPGYCEYVRLAFAIANDCGEAGREGFIALCSLSVKFNREKAERLFSNALKKGDHRIHLGTAFHLAELAGRPRDTHANNASNASNAAPFSHTRARDNNVEIEIEEQVDPFTHLPFFPEGHEWPRMLRQIMAFGQSREQRDVLLLGGLTTLVPIWRQMVLLQFANLHRRSPRLRKRRARMDANARATDPRRDPGDRGGGDEKV